MSSSSDDDILECYVYLRLRKKRKRYWRHPYIENNINCRLFVAANELSQDDTKCLSLYRMSKETYQQLLNHIAPAITKHFDVRCCKSRAATGRACRDAVNRTDPSPLPHIPRQSGNAH